MAAPELRITLRATLEQQRTNTFWTMKLVSAQRKCRNTQLMKAHAQPADGLRSIAMKWSPSIKHVNQFCDRLDSPRLVVGKHHADKSRIGFKQIRKDFTIYDAHGVNRQSSYMKTALFQLLNGLGDGRMFDRTRDHRPRRFSGEAEQCKIVGLGSAACEN